MQATRKFIQIIRFVFCLAIVLYLFAVLRIPSSATPKPILLQALAVVALTVAILIFVMRRIQVLPAEKVLETQPEDTKALARWRAGYVITYTLGLSITMYGLVLHFLGFSFPRVLPFFLAGIAPILFFGPKVPLSAASTSQSDPIIPR